MARRALLLLVVLAALLPALLSGCGDDVVGAPEDHPATGTTEQPPALVLHTAGNDVTASAGSYCWQSDDVGMCADAAMPDPAKIPRVRGEDAVAFTFPVAGWSFQASFSLVDAKKCDRAYTVDAQPTSDGAYTLPAAGPAGDYLVNVFGTGPQGDYGATFRWVTDDQGVSPTPRATASVVWKVHGKVEGQGFALSVTGLDPAPRTTGVRITATAANGRSSSYEVATKPDGCPTGDVYLAEDGSAWAEEVAALGPAPFTYDVTLTLDGVEHRASAVWPDDHVEDPYNDDPAPVPLDFVPAL